MDISKLHPEDTTAIDELWTMFATAKEHDRPHDPPLMRAMLQAEIDNLSHDEHHDFRLARIGGRIVGFVDAGRNLLDNKHFSFTNMTVLPEFRRRGIGTALLATAAEIGKAHGAHTQTATGGEPLPDGPFRTTDGRDFLLANGFSIANTMRTRNLELGAIEGRIEQDLLDESWPKADGYDLVQWVGATPDEHVPGAAALASRLASDVPFGDLEIEEVHYDDDRYRQQEARMIQRGIDFACTYVRHVASGELVAHSVVAVQEEVPAYGFQWITLVHPDHRGHRLGMIVKIENHRLLRRDLPGVRRIHTGNAEVNSHMVAINERLGFTELARQFDFQREI